MSLQYPASLVAIQAMTLNLGSDYEKHWFDAVEAGLTGCCHANLGECWLD